MSVELYLVLGIYAAGFVAAFLKVCQLISYEEVVEREGLSGEPRYETKNRYDGPPPVLVAIFWPFLFVGISLWWVVSNATKLGVKMMEKKNTEEPKQKDRYR